MVARMLVSHLPALRFDDAALGSLPAEVRRRGLDLVQEIGDRTHRSGEPLDWA